MIEQKSFDLVVGEVQRREFEEFLDFPLPESTTDLAQIPESVSNSIEVIVSGWGVPTMDEDFLNRFPKLKVVFHAAGSVKIFTRDALWNRGIRVTSAARLNAVPVAEFTFSQIVFCLKHAWQAALELRERKSFRDRDNRIPGTANTTIGIISLGHTGIEVVERLKSLDVKILAYDPHVSERVASELNVELVSLEELFTRSHVISCHTPLLPETKGMLRKHHFESMRPEASFINTARGAIVNEPELIEVLQKRPDIFAALDVTYPEPISPDSPLLTLLNAIVTPHLAGSLSHECRRMGTMMLHEVGRFLANKPLQGEVFQEELVIQA